MFFPVFEYATRLYNEFNIFRARHRFKKNYKNYKQARTGLEKKSKVNGKLKLYNYM